MCGTKWIVSLAAVSTAMSMLAGSALAIDGVYVRGSGIVPGTTVEYFEVEGFNGRMALNQAGINFQSPTPDPVAGIAVRPDSTYRLLGGIPGVGSIEFRSFPGNGGPGSFGSYYIPTALSDVTSAGNDLFVVADNASRLRVLRQIAQGSVAATTLLDVPADNAGGKWLLAGSPGVNRLLAYSADASGSSRPAYVIDATTGAIVNQLSIPAMSARVTDVALSKDGTVATLFTADVANHLRVDVATGATLASLPAKSALGAGLRLPASGFLGSDSNISLQSVSGVLSYSYTAADFNAYAEAAVVVTTTGLKNGALIRKPLVTDVHFDAQLVNGVAPAGATVAIAPLTTVMRQLSGPTLSIEQHPSTETSFSVRPLGTSDISLNTLTLMQGHYILRFADSLPSTGAPGVTGASLSTSRDGRRFHFAYDPVSANVIGNGAFTYEDCGWTYVSGYAGIGPGETMTLYPFGAMPAAIEQTLELPTATRPMRLSLDYRVLSGPVDLEVTLAGRVLASFSAPVGSTFSTFAVDVTDPSLFGLAGATLGVRTAVGSATSGYIYLDNFSLTAIVVPGDYNSDGYVDASDYTVWADSFGMTGTGLAADGNVDGLVDAADYTVWADHFGSGTPPVGVAAVPEPGVVTFGGLIAVAAMMRRRR